MKKQIFVLGNFGRLQSLCCRKGDLHKEHMLRTHSMVPCKCPIRVGRYIWHTLVDNENKPLYGKFLHLVHWTTRGFCLLSSNFRVEYTSPVTSNILELFQAGSNLMKNNGEDIFLYCGACKIYAPHYDLLFLDPF